ncbi:hypothetical protein [Leptospira sp. 'Mane']|uniref:hypothetical protein n=1 Tax=Leptospira sp. 'Mane' TaxID=3387407 RepID=UPI00398B62F4
MFITIIKSTLTVIGCMLLGGILGFFGPFILAQFVAENPAWSFIPLITVPIFVFVGLVAGLLIVFGQSLTTVLITTFVLVVVLTGLYILFGN